ncbi:MAG: hypothetical protein FWG98_15095, partial [Candidatus Cloacimonetes bacterium]|nr:hypothetical protein [Candidatus Cloacimonadota bacterium]
MKKIILSLFLLLIFIFLLCQEGLQQFQNNEALIQIGDGNTNNHQLPVWGEGASSYTQFIYLQSEINIENSQITKVSFYYNGIWGFGSVNNWELLIGHTEESFYTLSAEWPYYTPDMWIPMENFSKVFSGILPLREVAEWIDIELDTPFIYNNIDNLVFSVQNRSGFGSGMPHFRSTPSSPANRGLVSRSGYNVVDDIFPTPWHLNSNMPNIRIYFETVGEPLIMLQDFIPPLANESLPIFAQIENISGEYTVNLVYWINEDVLNAQTVQMIFENNFWTANIPASANLDGHRVCFLISLETQAKNLRHNESSVQKYFAGVAPISTIRVYDDDDSSKYDGFLARIIGVSLNAQGDFSNRIDNDFAISDGDSGIRVLGGESINATKGKNYQIIGKISESIDRLLFIEPIEIIDLGFGVLPKPFIDTVSSFIIPSTAKYFESNLIGISSLRLSPDNDWPLVTVTDPVRINLWDEQHLIPTISIPDNIGQYPTDMYFGLVGILGRDEAGFHILIRSGEDFYPTGVLSISLSSFTTTLTPENFVMVTWTTESENNMLGFHLLRADNAFIENAFFITENIIPALNTSNFQNYNFIDKDINFGKEYYYWLQAVENDYSVSHFGPAHIII